MCLGDWLGNTGEPRPGVRLAEKTNPGEMARRTPTDREFREWVRQMEGGTMKRFNEALEKCGSTG